LPFVIASYRRLVSVKRNASAEEIDKVPVTVTGFFDDVADIRSSKSGLTHAQSPDVPTDSR
jgi:hypothetical protein